MRQAERDEEQLKVIFRYCCRADSILERFESSYESFLVDEVFQDSCSLCLIQIGEAVNRLSEEFKLTHPEIPWSRIYGMRCHLVHGYDAFDSEIVWDALANEVPTVKAFCKKHGVEA